MNVLRNELSRTTLILILLGLVSIYPLSILVLGPQQTFELGNIVLLSFAIGLVVAYTPNVLDAFGRPMIDGAGLLAVAIWICWAGTAVGRMLSITWRLFGKPPAWLDNAIWSSQNAFLCTAAVCFMIAPEALSGRVPPKQWMKLGLTTAASVFVAAGYIILFVTD